MRTLLPLYVHPLDAPSAWAAATGYEDTTVVVNVACGPGAQRDPAYAAATDALAGAGVPTLGYVDLGYSCRPLHDLLTDVHRWAGYPVRGIFFDRAPTSPFSIGPVALAVRAARRIGLADLVLNPGLPPDPSYRYLRTAICVFEGGWTAYRAWAGDGAEPGDGHLVYGVPPADLGRARDLLTTRHAGFGLVTDRPAAAPYAGLPGRYAAPVVAGTVGRSTRTGS